MSMLTILGFVFFFEDEPEFDIVGALQKFAGWIWTDIPCWIISEAERDLDRILFWIIVAWICLYLGFMATVQFHIQ